MCFLSLECKLEFFSMPADSGSANKHGLGSSPVTNHKKNKKTTQVISRAKIALKVCKQRQHLPHKDR